MTPSLLSLRESQLWERAQTGIAYDVAVALYPTECQQMIARGLLVVSRGKVWSRVAGVVRC